MSKPKRGATKDPVEEEIAEIKREIASLRGANAKLQDAIERKEQAIEAATARMSAAGKDDEAIAAVLGSDKQAVLEDIKLLIEDKQRLGQLEERLTASLANPRCKARPARRG